MSKYIAFLRAINVGGHDVKMNQLKLLFEKMGFRNVQTFIASGNVIFESSNGNILKLQEKIEKHLFKSLGYDVATFIRTMDDLVKILKYKAFTKEEYEKAPTNCVGFIKKPLSKDQFLKLKELESNIDKLNSYKSEVFWLCSLRQSESTFSASMFEKKTNVTISLRGVKTLLKLAQKHSSEFHK
jgi:uncharacterized protein (DUF1697 family)